ncbi:major facilitator superfamily domain-containing protein [Chytriomyces cf. hyalinus JEL632]|nr:major facilitator superfamily domain-containing protein [Chytriomyces cf. hyalinus JEL632]
MGRKVSATHWLLLGLASVLLAGNYYCYDMPASMGTALQKWLQVDDDAFQWQLNSLYSASSLPNIFFPVIGGLLVDKLGPTMILLSFSALVFTGQLLFAVGLNLKNFSLLMAGRFLFGLGGESLEIVIARVLTDWFAGRCLAFALGVNLASARVLTALNDNISPRLAQTSVLAAAWTGVAVTVASCVGGIAVVYVDRDASRVRAGVAPAVAGAVKQDGGLETQETEPLLQGQEDYISSHGHSEEYVQEIFEQDSQDEPVVINTNQSGLRIIIHDAGYESEEFEEVDEKNVHWMQLGDLGSGFYLLCAVTIALYGATIPFFHICTTFFIEKWGLDAPTAGFVMSVPDVIAAIGSPIVGMLLDKNGGRANGLVFSAVTLGASHAVLHFSSIHPSYGMVMMGVGFSTFSTTLWSCVPLLVGEHQIATGFGLLAVALNVSLFTFPLCVAQIRNQSSDFGWVEYAFMALCAIGGLLSWSLSRMYPDLNRVVKNATTPVTSTSLEGYRRVALSPASTIANSPFPPIQTDNSDSTPDEEKLVARCVGFGANAIVSTSPTIIRHHHYRVFGDSRARSPSPVRRGSCSGGERYCSQLCARIEGDEEAKSVSPVRRRIHYYGNVVSGGGNNGAS